MVADVSSEALFDVVVTFPAPRALRGVCTGRGHVLEPDAPRAEKGGGRGVSDPSSRALQHAPSPMPMVCGPRVNLFPLYNEDTRSYVHLSRETERSSQSTTDIQIPICHMPHSLHTVIPRPYIMQAPPLSLSQSFLYTSLRFYLVSPLPVSPKHPASDLSLFLSHGMFSQVCSDVMVLVHDILDHRSHQGFRHHHRIAPDIKHGVLPAWHRHRVKGGLL